MGSAARPAARRGLAPRTTLLRVRLYDTFSRSLVELPAPPGPIRMYFCGPTVYARAHIGNARPFIVGMWLRSWLRSRGYDAQLVHNITDINDKIYDAAPGASAALAAQATEWYLEDTGDLGLGMPDGLPKATESVPQIVAFIEELVARGNAYESGGDVYFSVASFPEYGRLSRQKPDQVEQGEEPSPLKRDPRDFALWKTNKPATEDTWWESPWGRGRPGWHIECSVMAEEIFGPAFEIHGGGLDLVFPHHENEVAQSRALGHPFASIWAHNGMLEFTGDKMSKSAGNVTTIRAAIDAWGRETVLVFFLTASWRKPIDYSDETMAQAAARRDTLRNAFTLEPAPVEEKRWDTFVAALEDDFDTPAALAVLHEWAAARQLDLLARGLDVFGLASLGVREDAPAEVAELAERRSRARAERDFETSDRLRDELVTLGWQMRDEPGGGYTLVRS
jgi:cysteinyl-tRNA synthetase